MDPRLVAACGDHPDWPCDWVFRTTHNETLARAAKHAVGTPLRVFVIVVVAFIINRLVRRAIRRFTNAIAGTTQNRRLRAMRDRTPAIFLPTTGELSLRSAARAQTIGSVLRSMSTAIITFLAFLTILGELDVNLGPLIASAGIAGVAIGFGAQTLVKDFLTGIFMLIEDQYGVGDLVDLGPASGTIEGVNLRTTRVRDVQGVLWHIPNGQIERVGNKSQLWARALIDLQVGYNADLRRAEAVIQEVAEGLYQEPEWEPMLLEPPEVWGVEALAPDGVSIRLVIKTKPAEQFKVMRELRIRLKERFDVEDGIEIAYPARTVLVHGA
ncbi:MAG: moderate conductance mechanosensitive channel, partial [Acidimicrobiaceae bacterium]